jgi:hypothetical protein
MSRFFKFKNKDQKPVKEILRTFESDYYTLFSWYAYVPLYTIHPCDKFYAHRYTTPMLRGEDFFVVKCECPHIIDFIEHHSWDQLDIDPPIDLGQPGKVEEFEVELGNAVISDGIAIVEVKHRSSNETN